MGRQARNADQLTLLAFVGVIFAGGSNAVAIRLGNAELAPFWAATLRFGLAALILMAFLVVARTPLPDSRARMGIVLYGLTAFAGSYAALYWGLAEAPAATAQVVIAMVPLLTLLMAGSIRQERITARGVIGAAVAFAGIAVIVSDQLGSAVPLASLVALFVGTSFIALSVVLVKQVSPGHPVAANAFGMAIGAAVLAMLAIIAGEPLAIPASIPTWASLLYLVLVGSIGLFMLTLYVLARWSATASSYAIVAMPLVTVVVAALILGESVGPMFIVGSALVLIGVYSGISVRQAGQDATRSDEPSASRSSPRA